MPASGPQQREAIECALEQLRADVPVAFPTETVWGLAACARSETALNALRAWKGRDAGQPISLLVSGEEVLREQGFEVSGLAAKLIREYWPGPLTLVLRCSGKFAAGIAREEDGAVGVRCSSHPLAAEFVKAAEAAGLGPLTATSLNRSGDFPARSEAEARALCDPAPGGPHVIGVGKQDAHDDAPTTVLDLTGRRPEVIRWGGLRGDALRDLLELEHEAERNSNQGETKG